MLKRDVFLGYSNLIKFDGHFYLVNSGYDDVGWLKATPTSEHHNTYDFHTEDGKLYCYTFHNYYDARNMLWYCFHCTEEQGWCNASSVFFVDDKLYRNDCCIAKVTHPLKVDCKYFNNRREFPSIDNRTQSYMEFDWFMGTSCKYPVNCNVTNNVNLDNCEYAP